MAKIEIKKTELVWKGKYDEDGRLKPVEKPGPYPFQIVEVVNEPRIGKEVEPGETLSLFDYWKGDEGASFEEGWRNKLIWGDNKFVMSSLLENFAGKIDLIYIDPPFATGADFKVDIPVGENSETVHKEHSIIEEKAYRDTWGKGLDSFLQMLYERLILMKELLAETGTIYIHMDWYAGHHIKVLLDDIFGSRNSLGEIVWAYSKLVKAHDIIYIYSKYYGQHKYNTIYLPYSEKYIENWFKYEENGRRYRKRWRRDKSGKSYIEKQFLDESKGLPANTV